MSVQDELIGLLELTVIGAKDLPAMDLNGKADPFFIVQFGTKQILKSEIIKKTKTPIWNETAKVIISLTEKNYSINLSVWDWDKLSKNEVIGDVNIDVAPYFNNSDATEKWLPLTNKAGKNVGSVNVKAKMLTKDQVEEAFWLGFAKHFDTDNNGVISRTEFGGLATSIHTDLTDEEVDELFLKVAGDLKKEVPFTAVHHLLITEPRLAVTMLGHDANFVWHVYAESIDLADIGSKVFTKGFYDEAPDQGKTTQQKVILVHNRETGKLEEEKIPHYIYTSLRIMYSTISGRFAVEGSQVKKLLHHLSAAQGRKYDTKKSVHEIQPFIDFHNLNVNEMLEPLDHYQNFNEFFYRKLKPSARPVASPKDAHVVVSPADCRLNVFQSLDSATKLWIKGKNFTLKNLVHDDALVTKYTGCSLVIARLAPQDYHRFHLPIDCEVGPSVKVDGALFTVNPIAIREHVDVYTENKRIITTLRSPIFGDVLFIAVGATMVGSILLTSHEGQNASKGDEHGYFAFGGSTVLLLFRQGTITFDPDLLVNSGKSLETLVKVRTQIGVATNKK